MLHLYILCPYCISLCNPNGTGVIINENALSNINEIRLAVILQKKNRYGRDGAHRFFHAAWTCHGHSFVIICILCKSILLQITHHINGTAQKYSLFILTGKYLQILDTFYDLLLHNKADQYHHHKTVHVL
jgi:hypothetical protein